jgi:hypothetical protein
MEIKDTETRDFLANHNISPALRAKMVDWMVQVLRTMGCNSRSWFKSVQLFDTYFAKQTVAQDAKSVYLTGMVCMFIATKYEDVSPLLMNTVVNKLGQGKFSREQIMAEEAKILKVLGF